MKKLIALMFFLFFAAVLSAQQQSGALWGNIRDELSGDPISAARINLMQKGLTVKSTTSDSKGDFRFYAVPEGKYELSVDAEGYQLTVVEGIPVVKLKNQQLNLSFGRENSLNSPLIIPYSDLKPKKKRKRR